MRVILSLRQCFQISFSEIYYKIWKVKWLLMFPLLRWKYRTHKRTHHIHSSSLPACVPRTTRNTYWMSPGIDLCWKGQQRYRTCFLSRSSPFFPFPPTCVISHGLSWRGRVGGPALLHGCSHGCSPRPFWGSAGRGAEGQVTYGLLSSLLASPGNLCLLPADFFPSSFGM